MKTSRPVIVIILHHHYFTFNQCNAPRHLIFCSIKPDSALAQEVSVLGQPIFSFQNSKEQGPNNTQMKKQWEQLPG